MERGFAAYFVLMVENEAAFRLLYGREAPADQELSEARRRVEETIAQAIDPLIDAGLEPAHRLLLAHSVVGMAEGAGRHWLDARQRRQALAAEGGRTTPPVDPAEEAARLAVRLADLAWAGLRQVHRT